MINIDIKKVSLEEGTEVQQSKFCEVWETAKPVLEMLSSIIRNPIVKWVISLVVTVGDSVKERLCAEN